MYKKQKIFCTFKYFLRNFICLNLSIKTIGHYSGKIQLSVASVSSYSSRILGATNMFRCSNLLKLILSFTSGSFNISHFFEILNIC
jgi:hypothetical protein